MQEFVLDSLRHSGVDIVRALLQSGADVFHVDFDGDTALHLAQTSEIRRELKGQTPLHVACDYGDAEAVSHLLARGAGVCLADVDGCAPLHAAARKVMPAACVGKGRVWSWFGAQVTIQPLSLALCMEGARRGGVDSLWGT